MAKKPKDQPYGLYERYMSHGSTGTFGPTSIYGEEKVKPEPTFDELAPVALQLLEERAAIVAAEADAKRLGHDGGAGVIREKVQFYRAGLNRVWPKEWKSAYEEAKKAWAAKNDPEFLEFLRLYAKFGMPPKNVYPGQ